LCRFVPFTPSTRKAFVNRILNDKPFEHRSQNGTIFKAKRCDFVGGVDAFVLEGLTAEQIMEDAVELGAHHWANIVPELYGFTGPGSFRIHSRTPDEHEARMRLLQTPLMEFFAFDSLKALEVHLGTAARVHNILKHSRSYWNNGSTMVTVGDFLDSMSIQQLLRTPTMGPKSLEVVIKRLSAEGLVLPEQ